MGVYVILIVCLVLAVLRNSKIGDTALVNINNKVESINGTIISIEKAGIFEATPFLLSRGDKVYKFTYKVDGEIKEGWYKKGLFDKWVLDYQK